VLYQLARAQEQGGELETALKTLDQLVATYPDTAYREEAQFRRGELLFTLRSYPASEQAYDAVLARNAGTVFKDRAAVHAGLGAIQAGQASRKACNRSSACSTCKLAGVVAIGRWTPCVGLTRADRELVEDTFRVTSISAGQPAGRRIDPGLREGRQARSYEYRVYEQLGELYIKQDRVKDAADTYSAFVARQPLHAQAPQLQAKRDRHLRAQRLAPCWRSMRRSDYVVALWHRQRVPQAPTPKAGRRRSRW
jgi:tetratricopeptide (TPR) repeat protein